MHLQENTLFDIDLGSQNFAQYPHIMETMHMRRLKLLRPTV